VEKIFNDEAGGVGNKFLRQVGYDLFASQISTSAGTTGKYDNNYKLSVGEKVSIYSYGDSVDIMAISGASLLAPVMNSQVDSKGNIFVSGIGLVAAENKTISEVESDLNKLASKKYKNLKLKLNVAGGQDFSVFVYGQVNNPGRVVINNNSSLMDALSAAGGVKKTGTLRKIQYTTSGKTKEVDLYKTIFAGQDGNIILKANDKIFVTGVGEVVALKNGVTVPGIYEVLPGESLEKMISCITFQDR
jgi:protein involved in polysaccharide export with SLBB domain